MGNPEAHFSMAILLHSQANDAGNEDAIPLCVLHLAKAASRGHIRALGYISHGVFDPESWFNQYIRVVTGRKLDAQLLEAEKVDLRTGNNNASPQNDEGIEREIGGNDSETVS